MKLYDLKRWDKLYVDWHIRTFIKIDWMYWNFRDENWEFIIAFSCWADVSEYLEDDESFDKAEVVEEFFRADDDVVINMR